VDVISFSQHAKFSPATRFFGVGVPSTIKVVTSLDLWLSKFSF